MGDERWVRLRPVEIMSREMLYLCFILGVLGPVGAAWSSAPPILTAVRRSSKEAQLWLGSFVNCMSWPCALHVGVCQGFPLFLERDPLGCSFQRLLGHLIGCFCPGLARAVGWLKSRRTLHYMLRCRDPEKFELQTPISCLATEIVKNVFQSVSCCVRCFSFCLAEEMDVAWVPLGQQSCACLLSTLQMTCRKARRPPYGTVHYIN